VIGDPVISVDAKKKELVGTDADTGAFAVESIRRWWQTVGQQAYPRATPVIDHRGFGWVQRARLRLWKTELAGLAAQTGLEITVVYRHRAPRSGTGSNTGCSATPR
jgi:hypothetical protein